LAQQGFEFAALRVKNGAASPVEQRRASISLARSGIAEEHAEHELRASKRRLSAMWGATAADFERVEAALFESPAVESYEALERKIEKSPDLAAITQQRAQNKARLSLAEANSISDMGVSVGGRRAEGVGEYSFVFGVSIPIPLFQSNEGEIAFRQAEAKEIETSHEAARVRLLAELYGLIQELSHARAELEILDTQVLLDAQSVLELVTAGFRAGRFSQIELLDAQQTLVALEHERIDAAEEMWSVAIHIQGLMGAIEIEGADHE
jgi:cobalt-zinc-cadmium efflux system outer membrane protein